MARQPRLHLRGVPTHVIQRGNNRRACFVDADDRRFYLTCLAAAAWTADVQIHAYVLMTNHVHLLASSTTTTGLSRMMQRLGRRYVRRFNEAHGSSGTLWEGRFRSSLVDSERYLLECYRYIELNPVRARLVDDPAQFAWSSFHHHALGISDPLVTDHPVYLALGSTKAARLETYREFVRRAASQSVLTEIRYALNKGRVLGGETFAAAVENKLGRHARAREPGRPRKPEASPEPTLPSSGERPKKVV